MKLRDYPDHEVQALLFDFGNVLVEIDLAKVFSIWSNYAGGMDVFHDFSMNKDNELYEQGKISTSEFFNSLRGKLNLNLTDEQFLEGWNNIFVSEVSGIRETLSKVSHKLPLYLFSNTTISHHEVWSTLYPDLLCMFNQIFVSYELGARKPDAEAFLSVSKIINIDPKHILFFDDTLENVTAARKLGMSAVLVKTNEDVTNHFKFLNFDLK